MQQGQILDSKEFLAPIITPYEAQLAFSPDSTWTGMYRLDFESLLLEDGKAELSNRGQTEEPRFSLLDGRYHGHASSDDAGAASSLAIAERQTQELLNLDPSKRHLFEARRSSMMSKQGAPLTV